jgi:hypothetical protein
MCKYDQSKTLCCVEVLLVVFVCSLVFSAFLDLVDGWACERSEPTEAYKDSHFDARRCKSFTT